MGLKQITAKYSIVREDDSRGAEEVSHLGTARIVLSLESVLNDLKKRVSPYHPEGVGKCHCVKKLTIYAHGSNGALAFDRGLEYPMYTEQNSINAQAYERASRLKFDEYYDSWDKKDLDTALGNYMYGRMLRGFAAQLKSVGGLMCNKGKIRFIACGQMGESPADVDGQRIGRNFAKFLSGVTGRCVEVDGVGDISPLPYGKGWRTVN